MPDLSTFEGRRKHYSEQMDPSRTGITFTEYLKYSYHWLALEYRLMKVRSSTLKANTHTDALDAADAVLELRAEMRNL